MHPRALAARSLQLAVLLALSQGCNCGGTLEPDGGETPFDAGREDSGFDAGPTDAGTDAGEDPGVDAGEDAGVDAGEDAGLDAGEDAGLDAGPDAGIPGALVFDGFNDQVVLGRFDGGANERAFTVEVWFKTSRPTGTFFEVYGATGGADRFVFIEGGRVCFYVFNGGERKVCTPGGGFHDGGWHHAAGTLGPDGGTRVYADGVPGAALPTNTLSSFTTDTNFRLGYGHTYFVSPLVFFGGSLAEVRVWNVERSAAEILADATTHLPPTTPGLLGYWKLDEVGASTTAADATGRSAPGTLVNFGFTPSPWSGPGPF